MTGMLVFVRTPAQADRARDVGADRIAVRMDGSNNVAPLGAWAAPGTRLPISLVFSSLASVAGISEAVAQSGADEIRVPVATLPMLDDVLPPSTRRFGVVALSSVVEAIETLALAESKPDGLMIWPGARASDRLVAAESLPVLERAITACRGAGVAVSLAGGLEPPDISRLLPLGPDELCFDITDETGGPTRSSAAAHLQLLRDLVAGPGRVDEAEHVAGPPDRIFLRDWVVPVRIGAYAHEHAAPQRVRFSIEADIARKPRTSDLRDVVSYDLFTDSIRRLTVQHVELVETLAEDLAAAVLAHPRVLMVTVTVEKLDLGPGALGCRITRGKAG